MTPSLYERPLEMLQTLVRMDTTNPPGNEILCIQYLDNLLQEAGLATTILAKDPNRPNLIARLPGRGQAPGLVLQGHVDVVTTANQKWDHLPFGGQIIDGELWGRGSLDMKGGVVMMTCAVLRALAEGKEPAGDIVLTILADEEAGSDYGARFVTEQHPEQFAGVRYAIGEGGGGAQYLGGKRFYPLMVAEKQVCWLRTRFTGPGGHGSSPLRDGAMAKLGKALTALNANRLPVHLTPAMELMLDGLARIAPPDLLAAVDGLRHPATADATLDGLYASGAPLARSLDALLHNTVNATVVNGGFKTNVIPSHIELELDGRVLPGFTADDFMAELHTLLGDDLPFEIIRHDPGTAEVDMSLFPLLAGIVEEMDPEAAVIPSLVGGFTDGRMFTRLGIQNYGFLPVKLPPGINYGATVHGANERMPVEGLEFGVRAISTLLERYRVD
ncbi:MAG: M20/M25/M40 family metallo-hydrolase [Caldilineaceae bacterium]|nr:M20/M25/M40 family metallo-hydrolase [Caldilineaceae bacterium]HRJ44783.1 M20/M25/M40 family metallo-hydrolase [Caldilineaceae bacterium]